MRRFTRFFLIALLIASVSEFSLSNDQALAEPATEITVSAAISLKDVLDEIALLYRAENPDTKIHFNLGASGSLQLQIEQGAPVDVFISAAPKQMDALQAENLLVTGTRKTLVENELVLIVPKGKTGITSFTDLTRPEVKLIAVGEPNAVPAGKYAQEIISHFGIYDQLKSKFVEAQNVRQVLTFVETGDADAGIVYRTDAMTSNKVTVVSTAPEDSHSPVIYPVAIIKSSKNVAVASDFVHFLLGPKSRAVFQKYGFISANP